MSIFQNSFFSVAGQKERLKNAGATLKAAVTLQGVKVNAEPKGTLGKVTKAVAEAAASNPYAAALVGAGAIKAVSAAGATAKATSGLLGTTAASAVGGSAKSSYLKAAALGGAAGIAAGSLLGGGSEQTTTPSQTSNPSSNPQQVTSSYDYSNKYQSSYQQTSYSIVDSPGAVLSGSPYLTSSMPTTQAWSPEQTAPLDFTADQDTSASQTPTMNAWLVLALVGGAVFLLNKRS